MSRWSVVSSCLVTSLVACGGDRSDEPVVLDREAALESLDAAEIDALCADMNRTMQANTDYVDQLCTIRGIGAAEHGKGTCEAGRDACLAEPQQFCDPKEPGEPTDFEGCPDLTVGMYLDCIAQIVETSAAVLADVSCESTLDWVSETGKMTSQALDADATGPCAKVQDACPYLAF